MASRLSLSRRHVLRGMLGGAAISLGLPVFEAQMNSAGRAWANGSGFPRRFGLFFWGNGNLPDRWNPTTTGADYELSEQLAPLAAVREHMTVITGMSVMTGNVIPHGSGPAGFLGGAPLIPRGGDNYTFAGPSIDQVIAREIGGETRFRSIEFGAAARSGLSYNGPDSINPPEQSPFELFERIFGADFRAPGEEAIIDPTIALRRSVLDAVLEDARDLQRGLGANDRARLDQHLSGIRDLENRLARLEADPPNLASCRRPEAPEPHYPDFDGRPQLSAKNRAMCDVIALAAACDQTRVFSNWFSFPVNNLLFQGAEAGHHQLTHDEPGDQPQVHAIVLQLMAELRYFVQALQAIPEGDGTLLDNTALLATSCVSLGRTHSLDEYPILLFGRAGGALRNGFHYRPSSRDNASKVMLTLMRAVGVTAPSFGQEGGFTTDTVDALEA
jgi:hypothetical protein